jgi:long-chain fatty acid transport protein
MRSVLGSLLVISTGLAVWPQAARAGGFASARFGGEHGHPTTDNPTAIYYNPAGLALGHGTRVFVESLLVYRDASYFRPESAITNELADGESGTGTPADAVGANSGEATVTNMLVSPFLGVASDLGVENLGVGLALYAPFGGQASWDKNDAFVDDADYPGAVDGVARWSTMEGYIRELYLSAAGAYHIPDANLSIGVSFNVIEESVNTIRARNAAGTDDLVAANGNILEGRSLVDVSGTTFSAGIGLIWQPIDELKLGLSYQSQPGFGETEQDGDLLLKLGNGSSDVSHIHFLQELPDIYRFGASYQAQSDLELRFSADYTRWSVFDKQCLVDAENPMSNCALDGQGGATDDAEGVIVDIWRDWKDTFGVRGGASYWIDPKKELVAGLSFDSSAVPDYTIDPALIDMNKMVATLGGRFTLGTNVLLNLSYTHVFYFDRDVPTRADDPMDEIEPLPAPSNVPDHGGTYKQTIGLINLGAEYRF